MFTFAVTAARRSNESKQDGPRVLQKIDALRKKGAASIPLELCNALMALHGELGRVDAAQSVFAELVASNRLDHVSLSTMMSAVVANEQCEHALSLYVEHNAAFDDDVTHLLALKACATLDTKDEEMAIVAARKRKGSSAFPGALETLRVRAVFEGTRRRCPIAR